MSNFNDYESDVPQPNTAPNGHGTNYTIDPGAFATVGGSDFSFTAIAATPPPSFDPFWPTDPSSTYAHGISINTSVDPVYSMPLQHYPHNASNFYAGEWENSSSRVAGPSTYPVDNNYSPDTTSRHFPGLSIPPLSPASGGSPSSSSELQSLYADSPATPNHGFGPLPLDDVTTQVFISNKRPLSCYAHCRIL
jgi:hypothetical protein